MGMCSPFSLLVLGPSLNPTPVWGGASRSLPGPNQPHLPLLYDITVKESHHGQMQTEVCVPGANSRASGAGKGKYKGSVDSVK